MKNISYLIVLLSLFSCQSEKKTTTYSSDGYWEQIGYGKVIKIQDKQISVYDICKIDCHLSFEEEILDFGKIKRATKDSLIIQHGIDDWCFLRIEKLPELCTTTTDSLETDPIANFETFWHTFKEHYCSFELKNINWEEIYKEYRPKISEKTTDLELYLILEEITNKLKDGEFAHRYG